MIFSNTPNHKPHPEVWTKPLADLATFAREDIEAMHVLNEGRLRGKVW